MGRISKAKPHLTVKEIQDRIANAKNIKKAKKWLVIYNAMVAPREAKDIALHVGFTTGTVHQIISKYNRLGAVFIEGTGQKIRNKAYLTYEEEKEVLQPFIEAGSKGEIATVSRIQAAYEGKIGHPVDDSTIYRILQRHEWRKVIPRSYHVKSNKEDQLVFKKLS